MDDISSRSLLADPATRRALQLDTLSAILPMERRDRLAELLTDDDVATLKHLAREGMGENSLRALSSDLAYLEAWAQAATGAPLPWPASESLALKYVAQRRNDQRFRLARARGIDQRVQFGIQEAAAEGEGFGDDDVGPVIVDRREAELAAREGGGEGRDQGLG